MYVNEPEVGTGCVDGTLYVNDPLVGIAYAEAGAALPVAGAAAAYVVGYAEKEADPPTGGTYDADWGAPYVPP